MRALDWQWGPFDGLSATDLHAVLQLRQDVFVIEQRCIYPDIDGCDPRCLHGRAWVTHDAGRTLAACARIVPPGLAFDPPSIGRVVVQADWRGHGLGRILMQGAIRETRRAHPGQAISLSAQAHLVPFYRRLGFSTTGPVYDDAGIAHQDMRLGT